MVRFLLLELKLSKHCKTGEQYIVVTIVLVILYAHKNRIYHYLKRYKRDRTFGPKVLHIIFSTLFIFRSKTLFLSFSHSLYVYSKNNIVTMKLLYLFLIRHCKFYLKFGLGSLQVLTVFNYSEYWCSWL